MLEENLTIACILDEFDFISFSYECNLMQITPQNWQPILSKKSVNLLFVSSAWRGINNSWRGKLINQPYSSNHPLFLIIQFCQLKKIPTVFWSKEDPVNFNCFINTARFFDYIFTTDRSSIKKYRTLINHKQIYVLPFGVQPIIHNPVGRTTEKKKNVAFAGSWYENKYPQRKIDLDILLKPAVKFGLDIYDRNNNRSGYRFPERYQANLRGSLSYIELAEVYKKYNVFINVNSVKDSPTMFSRRILELLACGVNVISNENKGIKSLLKGDIIQFCKTEKETELTLSRLLQDDYLRERLSLLGQREVFSRHTIANRLYKILERLKFEFPGNKKKVSVIACTDQANIESIINNYQRQSYQNKELIIVSKQSSVPIRTWQANLSDQNDISLYQIQATTGRCLNYAIEESRGDYYAFFDGLDYYGPDYLTDLVNCFLYVNAPIVGKLTQYVFFEDDNLLTILNPGHEYQYDKFVYGSTEMIKKEVFEMIRFKDLNQGYDTRFNLDCREAGFQFYSADRFNYVRIRKKQPDIHEWKISNQELIEKCEKISQGKVFLGQVIF